MAREDLPAIKRTARSMEGQPPLDPHSGIASPGSPIAAASDGVAAVASFDVGHLRRAALEVLAARQALAARLTADGACRGCFA